MRLLDGPFAEALRCFAETRPGGSEDPAHLVLLREYKALCQQAVEALAAELAPPRGDRMPYAEQRAAQDELALLRAEWNTWHLLEWLYQDWPRTPTCEPLAPTDATSLSWACADEQAIVDRLFQADGALKIAQSTIQWLESIAYDRVEYVRQDAFHRNTLFRLAARIETEGLVTEVDADAPHRSGLKLDEEDERDERLLLRAVWQLVRSGRHKDAQQLCDECGQPWRAASLLGGQLWHRQTGPEQRVHGALCTELPPSDSEALAGTLDSWVGNPNRGAWLASCKHLSETSSFEHERALYAALCGELPALLEVAQGWEDISWAKLKALVHRRVEDRLAASRELLAVGSADDPEFGAGSAQISEQTVEAALDSLCTGEGGSSRGEESPRLLAGGADEQPSAAWLAPIQRQLVLHRMRRATLGDAQMADGRWEGQRGQEQERYSLERADALALELAARLARLRSGRLGCQFSLGSQAPDLTSAAAAAAAVGAQDDDERRVQSQPVDVCLCHFARFSSHVLAFLRHAAAVESRALGLPEEPSAAGARAVQHAYARALAFGISAVPPRAAASSLLGLAPAPRTPGTAVWLEAEAMLPAVVAQQVARVAGDEPESALAILTGYLRRLSASGSLTEEQQAHVLSAASPALPQLLPEAACAALDGLLHWWPHPDSVPDSEGRELPLALAFRALGWLTLPIEGEGELSARARLCQALVHANRLTAAMVEGGSASELILHSSSPVDGSLSDGGGASDADLDASAEPRLLVDLTLAAPRVNSLWSEEAELDERSQRVNNAIAEFYSWLGYLRAVEAYNRWWGFASRNADPALAQAAGDQSTLWRAQLHAHAKHAVDCLLAALHTPHGWLEDHHDGGVPATGQGAGVGGLDEAASEERARQLTRLKAECVPQMVELAHSVLLQTARLDSNVELATRSLHEVTELVADEHYRLYAHFTPQRMRTLLGLLRKSALVIFELTAN